MRRGSARHGDSHKCPRDTRAQRTTQIGPGQVLAPARSAGRHTTSTNNSRQPGRRAASTNSPRPARRLRRRAARLRKSQTETRPAHSYRWGGMMGGCVLCREARQAKVQVRRRMPVADLPALLSSHHATALIPRPPQPARCRHSRRTSAAHPPHSPCPHLHPCPSPPPVSSPPPVPLTSTRPTHLHPSHSPPPAPRCWSTHG
eukprot:scaffold35282_cov90-Isochrysis_galbana.AAC.1